MSSLYRLLSTLSDSNHPKLLGTAWHGGVTMDIHPPGVGMSGHAPTPAHPGPTPNIQDSKDPQLLNGPFVHVNSWMDLVGC